MKTGARRIVEGEKPHPRNECIAEIEQSESAVYQEKGSVSVSTWWKEAKKIKAVLRGLSLFVTDDSLGYFCFVFFFYSTSQP